MSEKSFFPQQKDIYDAQYNQRQKNNYDNPKHKDRYDNLKHKDGYDNLKHKDRYDNLKHKDGYDNLKHKDGYDNLKHKDRYNDKSTKQTQPSNIFKYKIERDESGNCRYVLENQDYNPLNLINNREFVCIYPSNGTKYYKNVNIYNYKKKIII
jgi:hypothetical protein